MNQDSAKGTSHATAQVVSQVGTTDTPSPPGIRLRGLSKRYGGADSPLVIQDLDFDLPHGCLSTLLGPSGCGKTTLLRLIAGLEVPTAGRILIDGEDVTERSAAQRNVSMVFQSYALFPHLDVAGNVGYGLRVIGVPAAALKQKVADALEAVGLTGLHARMPGELSGGQQQRVAVARALVLEPAVMLFDEPLSNLDAGLRRAMREEIRELQQRLRLTVVYVTHDQAEALAVSDRVIVMDRGRIAQAGSPRELYERPQSAFVAGFMGEAMLLDGIAEHDGRVRIGAMRLGAQAPLAERPGPLKVAVRPQAWRLSEPQAPDAPPPEERLSAEVLGCAYLGSHLEIRLRAEGRELLAISGDTHRTWRSREAALLSLPGRSLSLLPA